MTEPLLDPDKRGRQGVMKTYPHMRYVDLFDFQASDVKVLDIIHHLCMITRYGGGTRTRISVGEHSIMAADRVPNERKLDVLFHDRAEAYLGDVIRPIKHDLRFGPVYHDLEDRIEAVSAPVLGLVHPMPRWVKDADNEQLMHEMEHMRYVDRVEPSLAEIESAFQAMAWPLLAERIGEHNLKEIW